ncbi:MAG: ribonucleoside-diphosphate reductase subunit alpha [Phenylobacterium sp.]|uniref:ribonucleoside-diphosphate reductase subunit alpha n=4 Tax=Phenylobacterium sp. TaxID=1871053 RepID=UPI002600A607|nr:ribonucleoside-diphosphate reductase subunit alpha [Phenylobacterium sp.]MCA3716397.1 ribonucleoside-diphosphate reductase subunit alpha [Phenylobacterium sp.]MCA3727927.1 ribonucleoside-diphosphate reductase subunit alpha [Phenylobacterium sp.]MCA3731381.1 ribonucleoside-diphosphate reductase subunit alpha [Phenylobacterium sp.]MCA3745079.1 ribonucleoside-diphosphate reductase subunit alpha [Phenylobacterium sp.]MCA6278825.1 ribonucleoside-diphosphate reductase subunit alpha [Phenylobacter
MSGGEAVRRAVETEAKAAHERAERPQLQLVRKVQVDRSRDALLTDFGKTTLEDRYLLPGESYQDMFARVATAYADDADHAQRVYDYISRLWFMPATPVLSNGGADRGLPISCFLNAVNDSLDGIQGVWNENVALASNGGGIGTYWGGVRSIGEKVKGAGQTSGIIPFIRVMDSLTLAISQGSLRRGSAAVYLDIHHPEIEEFLEIRKPSGDFNRKSLNLHHGISITDEFMEAVRDGAPFGLRSPKTGEVLREVDARGLWQKILEIRLQTGEPYLIFSDTVNRSMPQHQRDLGLSVRQSNLCSEIMLHTGLDHLGKERTAVCCLSSVNAETFLEWRDHPTFIEDVMRFLDNVLEDFITRAPSSMANAIYAARRERSVGLGLMGFHSFLQMQNVPFESAMAKSWNMRLFKHLRRQCDAASRVLAAERGPCPDAAERGVMERFSHKLAIAPTASISIICGGTSAGIEPIPANIYTHKTLSGTFAVRNPYLERLLEARGQNIPSVWDSILENEGSVQHLDVLTQDEKDVFKTAFELDQRWVVELAADRTPDICQSQSVNIFLPGDVDKWDLHMLHWSAWEQGCKSLYYLRSKSVQRAAHAGAETVASIELIDAGRTDYEECLACQ